LEKISDENSPQPGDSRVESREEQHPDNNHDRAAFIHAERDLENLHHRQVYPAEDDAVDRQAKIQSPEATQESGRFAGVTKLGKLDVSHHACAPPQSRVKKDGEHSAHVKVPPEPVAGDAVFGDEARD